jgi:hypothetical protein
MRKKEDLKKSIGDPFVERKLRMGLTWFILYTTWLRP